MDELILIICCLLLLVYITLVVTICYKFYLKKYCVKNLTPISSKQTIFTISKITKSLISPSYCLHLHYINENGMKEEFIINNWGNDIFKHISADNTIVIDKNTYIKNNKEIVVFESQEVEQIYKKLLPYPKVVIYIFALFVTIFAFTFLISLA